MGYLSALKAMTKGLQGRVRSAKPGREGELPLHGWLWRSYLSSALIPLLVIELSFLLVYVATSGIVYDANVDTVRRVSRAYLHDVASREALTISNELKGISNLTSLWAAQSKDALDGNYVPPKAEKLRHTMTPSGAFVTRYDNGKSASFYSGVSPIGPAEIQKVWKLAALDPIMVNIKNSSPLISSIYFNTNDSYNKIYPYFDVTKQYPKKMDIPSYNFYYEADAAHNPGRKAVWTDAYVDPAGHGWMVSSIAPVWRGGTLEGVVGIDVTLDTIIKRLNALDLPWDGYALLVDRGGGIIAMPPAGERDLGLRELTRHSYNSGITSDTFKPSDYNLARRADTRELANAMFRNKEGSVAIDLNGPRTASFSTIAGPDWFLVIVAPTNTIFAPADRLRQRTNIVSGIMAVSLLLFYVIFFAWLYRWARSKSRQVAEPVERIAALVEQIGQGSYHQAFEKSGIAEIDQLGSSLVQTGDMLGRAHEQIVEQEQQITAALAHREAMLDEQIRFSKITSHELRTPLAIIDSTAQIMERKAERMTPVDIRSRASRLRKTVARMSELVEKLMAAVQASSDRPAVGQTSHAKADLRDIIHMVASDYLSAGSLIVAETNEAEPVPFMIGSGGSAALALRSVIENAVRYGGESGPVRLNVNFSQDRASVWIIDQGPGIPEAELPLLGGRFYRGASAFSVHGAGMGLHVVHREMEALGGIVELSSSSAGTRVRLVFPLDQSGTEA